MIMGSRTDTLISRMSQLCEFVSHRGEQGRLAELVISEWLRIALPQKYSIGTGFIASVCDAKKLRLSTQQDIIIYDNQHCSPIFRTAVGGIFPIESVYATIEVKKTLKKGEKGPPPRGLYKAFRDIKTIRSMAADKTYLLLDNRSSIASFFRQRWELPPRSYIVAYQSEIGNIGETVRSIIEDGEEFDTHYHGIMVLETDTFSSRPHQDSEEARHGSVCETTQTSGWETFSNRLILDLESMDVNILLNQKGYIIDGMKYPIPF
jgi:hypothetical protein